MPIKTGIVVIGRNEGERLVACLRSVAIGGYPVVYVDSGSTDGSIQQAKNLGAEIVVLDMSSQFTAARARNAGLQRLNDMHAGLQSVQFVDGDCVVVDRWLVEAEAFLEAHNSVAVVCGRLREIHPEATIYNQFCDIEWDTPVGEVKQCGGIAMMRISALLDIGGFRSELIAGEEPELCLRLREKNWEIWRLQNEMATHDANIQSFGQWWRRTLRGGFAYAAVSTLHANSPLRIWRQEIVRAISWSTILPIMIVTLGAFYTPALWLFLVYALQVARIAFRRGATKLISWQYALFMTIAKFAETFGVLKYLVTRF